MPPVPPGFAWGVATSAYQIEGAWNEDGKGPSIWDRFVHLPGRIHNGETGDVACDHYHRWREDVQLMAELGVNAYRFSISWSRVLPDGDGAINRAGLGFYDALVDALLEHGIAPWVTLYHWDLPQALADRGGWPDRSTVEAFAHYAGVMSGALGDRVTNWMTHNEPWVAAFAGHLDGVFAPGLADWGTALRAAHHLLLSHGRAVPVIRAASPGARVGIAIDCRPSRPAGPAEADVAAQRHFDGFRNRWFFDPVFGKGYPPDMVAAYRERGRFQSEIPPFVQDGDLAAIAAPIDFVGINYYTSLLIRAGADETEDTGVTPGPNPPAGHTEMGWPITPDALPRFLRRIHDDYRPAAIVITENGASYSDGPDAEGNVHDSRRIAYLAAHIEALGEALAAGVPLAGYFAWSLLDNFEWTSGYSQRFGLVWVDFPTGTRTPKDSFAWYREALLRSGPEP